MLEATVAPEQSGMRLDRFLAATFPEISRSRLQQLIDGGSVTRRGEKLRDANTRVKPAEIYDIRVPPPLPAVPLPQAIPLKVVHEDKDLIVINKPAGLVEDSRHRGSRRVDIRRENPYIGPFSF